jgi:hypothetical protein
MCKIRKGRNIERKRYAEIHKEWLKEREIKEEIKKELTCSSVKFDKTRYKISRNCIFVRAYFYKSISFL